MCMFAEIFHLHLSYNFSSFIINKKHETEFILQFDKYNICLCHRVICNFIWQQEMLEDILNRTLTREYLDVLKVVLVGGSAEMVYNAMEQDDMECTRINTASIQAEVMSELGALTLRNEATCQPIALCVLR